MGEWGHRHWCSSRAQRCWNSVPPSPVIGTRTSGRTSRKLDHKHLRYAWRLSKGRDRKLDSEPVEELARVRFNGGIPLTRLLLVFFGSIRLKASVTPQTYLGQRLFTKTLRGRRNALNVILLVYTPYGLGTSTNFPPCITHIPRCPNKYPVFPISSRILV